ncbi:MAG: hypothetical protein AB2693_22100 [Candidatus Thiodiazotropha sp.]
MGKNVRRKKPRRVTRAVVNLCDERGNVKKQNEAGAKEYSKANKRAQRALHKAKEGCVDIQYKEIATCLNKISSKKTYQMVKNLILQKQGRSITIQDKSGNCHKEEQEICGTEEQEIHSIWTEYYSELYTHERCGASTDMDCI